MALMTRLTTLLRADAHGVMDSLEDRALTLRQHLREAEEEADRGKVRLEALESEEKGLRAEAARLETRLQELEEDVELTLAQNQSELARFAIRKLLPLRRRQEQVRHRTEALAQEREPLGQRIGAQQEALEDLRLRVRAYLERRQRAADEPGWSPLDEGPVSDEEVELELLRRQSSEASADAGGKNLATNAGGS